MPRWFQHRSFQARLSTLVAVAVGVAVALASVVAYLAVSNQLYSGVNRTLEDDLSRCESNGGPSGNCLPFVGHREAQVAVFTASGVNITDDFPSSVYGETIPSVTIQPSRAQLALTRQSLPRSEISNQTYSGARYRVLAVPFSAAITTPAGTTTANVVVLIAQPLAQTLSTLSHLRLILVLVVLLGVALAVFLGMLVARTTIRPVEQLTAAAEHVAATQSLDATIDETSRDELGRLAHAFNEMLGALRSSRQQQAQLVSDAGHELRTPLTSLRTNVEFLMRARDMPDADRDELLADVQGQLEELTSLVGDIVETARQDEQRQREYTEVRLDNLVERAVERARRRAPSLSFDVAMTPGSVRAQPALLERAVLNVLDNAAKWSLAAGPVEVRLHRGARWRLEIRDHGPGIAAEDLPHVLDRFYRASTARSMPGSGLGLAIVSQVVSEHGGTVEISTPSDGGTLVRIDLPTVEEDEPVVPPLGAWLGGAGGTAEPSDAAPPSLVPGEWAAPPPSPSWPEPAPPTNGQIEPRLEAPAGGISGTHDG